MKIKSIFIILGLSLCLNIHAHAYELKMTTYYPVPYGHYEQVQSDKLAVGDINKDGKLTGLDMLSDTGALAVEDNIYLGKGIAESNRSPEMVVKTPDARPTPFNADTADSDQTVLSIKDKDNKNLFNVDDTGFVEARDYQFIDADGNEQKVSDFLEAEPPKQCSWEGNACQCYGEFSSTSGYMILSQKCYKGILFPISINDLKYSGSGCDCPLSKPPNCDTYLNGQTLAYASEIIVDVIALFLCEVAGWDDFCD